MTAMMPKLSPKTQIARREHILDAAERCFTKAGFHATTMQDICEDAGVSAGALYTYFSSKDALVLGLCDRELDRFVNSLEAMADADDFLAALQAMAEHFCCDEPVAKVQFHIEIGAEAARNPLLAAKMKQGNDVVVGRFVALLEREQKRGRLNPSYPLDIVVRAMSVIGDGLFWHRAIDPSFDPRRIIPAVMTMISALITPTQAAESLEK